MLLTTLFNYVRQDKITTTLIDCMSQELAMEIIAEQACKRQYRTYLSKQSLKNQINEIVLLQIRCFEKNMLSMPTCCDSSSVENPIELRYRLEQRANQQ